MEQGIGCHRSICPDIGIAEARSVGYIAAVHNADTQTREMQIRQCSLSRG